MPAVYPFRAVRYALPGSPADLSALVAPPYDVLDRAGRDALVARSGQNIVTVDLPHIPAKELGPPEVYAKAAATLRSLLSTSSLKQDDRATISVYRQTFQTDGVTVQRTGVWCTLDVQEFGRRPGGGILPHEQTFSGPKEDRMALLRATGVQLSPIFGLHEDAAGKASAVARSVCQSRGADATARTDDGTFHELWRVDDPAVISAYQRALEGEDVFIADGHHRYTTGLNRLRERLAAGEQLAPDAPGRRCMFVLVSMADPGLVIWPTHRVLGGMSGYSWEALLGALEADVQVRPVSGDIAAVDAALAKASELGEMRFGLFDFATGQGAVAAPKSGDPLGAMFPDKPTAWRTLVVAWIQHHLVEHIAQPKLNGGKPVKWAFPHTVAETAAIGAGAETGAGGGDRFAQVAVLVRPTPLSAVREISRAGELMPQKSTFFYPKLATGMCLHPIV